MTREEEIKDKLETYHAKYIHWQSGRQLDSADDDFEYLLTRNEELQRRVDSALSIVNRQIEGSTRTFRGGVVHINCHMFWNLMDVLEGLDAKEQDDG